MSVENRSFARTGTMSSFEYLTTRAASVAARAGTGAKTVSARKTKVKVCSEKLRIRSFIDVFLSSVFGAAQTPGSRLLARENFKAFLEAVGLKSLFPFFVVVGIVGVKPVAFRIDIEIGDFRKLRRLDQKLLFGDQVRDQLDFVLVQMKLPAVELAIHVGIGEEDLRRAAFDDDVENVRPPELIKRLRGEHHRRVVLAPRLERFDDIALNARVLQEYPGFVDKESLEQRGDLASPDHGVRAVQDVEQQRFEKFGVLAHFLEVKALKARKGNVVFRVIKKEPELPSTGPFREPSCEVMAQRIGEHAQRAQFGIHGVKVLDLMVEVPLRCPVDLALHEDLQKQRQEIEILLGGIERERIDLEVF